PSRMRSVQASGSGSSRCILSRATSVAHAPHVSRGGPTPAWVISERLAMTARGQEQVHGERGADIGEAAAPAQGCASNPWTEREHRDALARVIAAAPGRIAAMVARNDREIAVPQRRDELRHARVERFERGGVT